MTMTLPGKTEADAQRVQLSQYLTWIDQEGGVEGPGRLRTYLQPAQLARMEWLKSNATGTILEAGCSWGFILNYIGGEYGLDINEQVVKLARILSPDLSFETGDIRNLSFHYEEDTFDTILLTEVLEHIPWGDVPGAIDQAKKVAKQLVLITVPLDEYMTSPKHIWVAGPERQQELIELVQPWTHHNDGQFLYLKIKV
jgi:hypothetical protein